MTVLKSPPITRCPWQILLALWRVHLRNLTCRVFRAYRFTGVKGTESSVHTKIKNLPFILPQSNLTTPPSLTEMEKRKCWCKKRSKNHRNSKKPFYSRHKTQQPTITLNISSWKVNGLRSPDKRTKLLRHLLKLHTDIALLQRDTFNWKQATHNEKNHG